MDGPAAQEQQPEQLLTPEQLLQQQADSQKIMSAIQGGLAFLADETVNGPIKYSDGISDLKWLLRMLISGEYGINTDPNQLRIEGKASGSPPAGSKEGGGQSPGGNGGTPSV
ncbi:hypothetical protein LCGC14_1821240 [marine sediment metagenome]|uniref:Uncharacterized protein n=1 Tax=marine sediment metagenome TaxID=412755 RepID=A0A0F9GIY3_9ZZZZ